MVPDHIRSDNGSEFTAESIRDWLPNAEIERLKTEISPLRLIKGAG